MSRQTTARTWHFRVRLRMPALSQQEEVRDTFKEILVSADDRLPICGLEQSSFSYDLPDNGIAEMFGYLHVNNLKRSLLYDTSCATCFQRICASLLVMILET
jgi:hypothetical protein